MSDLTFGREELHGISARATSMAELKGVNSEWAGTYRRLAEAADELDRRMDRSTIREKAYLERIEGCLEVRFAEHEVS